MAVCYLLLTLPPLLLVTEMIMPTGCCTRPACPADSRSKCGGSTGAQAEQVPGEAHSCTATSSCRLRASIGAERALAGVAAHRST